MPWSGGTYTKPRNHQTDDAAGIAILSENIEEDTADLEAGVNACLNASGQNPALGNLPMGGFVHTSAGVAVSSHNYVRADQARGEAQAVTWVSAIQSGNGYEGSATPALTAYTRGLTITFYATSANDASAPTLNVNGVSAAVIRAGTSAITSAALVTGGIYTVVYDGSGWQLQTPI